jgi:hypothetical protein
LYKIRGEKMFGHIVFVVIHIVALGAGGAFLLGTIPLHILFGYARGNKQRQIEQNELLREQNELLKKPQTS